MDQQQEQDERLVSFSDNPVQPLLSNDEEQTSLQEREIVPSADFDDEQPSPETTTHATPTVETTIPGMINIPF